MTRALLQTKIRIPPITQPIVDRTRLTGILESAIDRFKLVAVSAPAGYGKTTLLARWARESQGPVAWLSLSEDDDDFEFFFRLLTAAWEVIQPDIAESRLGLLAGSSSLDHDALLAAFIDAGLNVPEQTVFVVDDYQYLQQQPIHEAVSFLLDNLPPSLHFVIAGRTEPPLPLARYRARRELLEVHTPELQFLPKESDALLNGLLHLDLAQDEVMRLQHQTEGWITAMQLAAQTLKNRHGGMTLTLTGQHRHIADFLSQEVVRDVPADIRQFLLQTSILEELSAGLCDAVTDRDDGQEMLERLERDGHFVAPLDDYREWYRYHPIFASFIRQMLERSASEDDIVLLHRRAGGWYLEHDLPEAAFRHILAGQNADLMFELFEQYVYLKISSGEVRTVQRWVDSLPVDWLQRRPEFGFHRLMLLLATGSYDTFLELLGELEHRLAVQQEDAPDQRGRVIAFRCFLACFQNDLPAAQEYADQALKLLPHDDDNFRPGVFGALGDTFRRNGFWDDAHSWYLKLFEFANVRQFQAQSVHFYGALADLSLRQGHLQEAARNWRQALTFMDKPENYGRFPLPLTGWVDVRMAELLYEWDELTDAHRFLKRGLDRAELGGDVRTLIAARLIETRLSLVDGDINTASNALEQARELLSSAAFPEWIALFNRVQVGLWLADNQIDTAVHWASSVEPSGDDGEPETDITYLAAARALTARKGQATLERAMSLLTDVLETTASDGRMGLQIEALALKALAHWQRSETTDAIVALERGLRLAEPEGYVRLFADLGLPMALLLQEARSRGIAPDYVDRLLHACGTGSTTAEPHAQLPEPLTEREQEIVQLIAVGLTNGEIASQLFISTETVKKHAANVYAKLGVHNRTEAVARARHLELLD